MSWRVYGCGGRVGGTVGEGGGGWGGSVGRGVAVGVGVGVGFGVDVGVGVGVGVEVGVGVGVATGGRVAVGVGLGVGEGAWGPGVDVGGGGLVGWGTVGGVGLGRGVAGAKTSGGTTVGCMTATAGATSQAGGQHLLAEWLKRGDRGGDGHKRLEAGHHVRSDLPPPGRSNCGRSRPEEHRKAQQEKDQGHKQVPPRVRSYLVRGGTLVPHGPTSLAGVVGRLPPVWDTGRRMRKVLPAPSWLSTWISPSWALTIARVT